MLLLKLNGRNNMAWVAIDAYGDEYIFQNKPKRDDNWWVDPIYESFDEQGGTLTYHHNSDISLPKGSIKKLIDKNLDWSNEPVELKED